MLRENLETCPELAIGCPDKDPFFLCRANGHSIEILCDDVGDIIFIRPKNCPFATLTTVNCMTNPKNIISGVVPLCDDNGQVDRVERHLANGHL